MKSFSHVISHCNSKFDRPVVLLACGRSPSASKMNEFLSRHFTLIFCPDCNDVVALAGLYYPDLIVMSADSKYCEGLSICEKLQKNIIKKRPAQVMLFGPADDLFIDQAFASGADEYIPEPIHWKLFLHRANLLVNRRRDGLDLMDFTDKLEKINRELQDFTNVVSHDLQEPLHLIRAFSERIITKSHSILDQQGELYVQRIQLATSRMQSLIDGLLLYSRLTTQARDFTSVNLTQVVEEVVSDLEVRIDRLGATIKIADLGVIEADPIQMRQLFQNLMSNSLKYSSNDRSPYIEITSTCKKTENLDVFCQITVKDNGIGFDSCFHEKIFGMFQRLHGRDEYNGTGIGLAICKKIVERHGGTISARSSIGEGSEFIVVLPVQQKGRKNISGE